MGKLLAVLLVLAALVGGGIWLVTQPAGDVQPVEPSSAAVIRAEAKIFAAFATAAGAAVLSRHPVQATVNLTDEELTSLVDSRLAQDSSSSVSNVVVHGTSEGVFQTTADVQWNGWTFHIYATGTITFAADNTVHVDVHEANVGKLPLPKSMVDAVIAQNGSAASLNVPPGISNLALDPVEGGAVLKGTVSPDVRKLLP